MDFVVAIKTLPDRVAKETKRNNIVVLLTEATQVAEVDIVHRDKAYLKKLEGICFDCFKLNAEPPQDICEPPEQPEAPRSGCQNYDNPCACFDCPETPCQTTCSCIEGYPIRDTPGLGSGYWVGLQANNYYSNQANSGWLVAVQCSTGDIVGAFPVSNSNFGYGRGTILGEQVMVYPAGAVYGSGYTPQNKTSFPLLGLLPEDGDAIVSGFNLYTLNSQLGTPLTNSSYFCDAENSYTVSMPTIPQGCLTKYGPTNTNCSEFNLFPVQPNYTGLYYLDVKNILEFPTGLSGQTVIRFLPSGSFDCATQSYSSVVSWTRVANDALGGNCGGENWPDIPCSICDSCVDCNPCIPCQFVNNLTNGEFNISYYGYNAANGTGYMAIGPSNPPYMETEDSNNSSIANTNFWETWWGWDSSRSFVEDVVFNFSDSSPLAFVIPPIQNLQNKCCCADGCYNNSFPWIVESFDYCCNAGIPEYFKGGDGETTTFYRKVIPGAGSCLQNTCAKCFDKRCANNVLGQNSRVTTWGYTPCRTCVGGGLNEGNFDSSSMGMWILQETQDERVVKPQLMGGGNPSTGEETVPFGSSINICEEVFAAASGLCDGNPCTQIMILNENGKYIFSLENFILCTQLLNINTDCFKVKYLPQQYQNKELRLIPVFNGEYDHPQLIKNIEIDIDGSWVNLFDLLYQGDGDTNYWYNNNFGPLGAGVEGNCGPFISQLAECSTTFRKTIEVEAYPDCSTPEQTEITVQSFYRIRNNKCKKCSDGFLISATVDEAGDPCSCCSQTDDGCIESIDPNSPCSCPICCVGDNCSGNSCPLPPNIIISSSGGKNC